MDRVITRYRAAATHLAISASIVGTLLAIVFFVWYPGPVFAISGTIKPVYVLVGVDLVLGPLLTLIVYKQGKRGMKFDLTVIALVQLVALLYGGYTLYSERPQYLVFAVDRFNLVATAHVDEQALASAELGDDSYAGMRQVFARRPEDPAEFQRFMDSTLFQGKPDLERRPEYWEPYANGATYVIANAIALTAFVAKSDADAETIAGVTTKFVADHPALALVPVTSFEGEYAALVDLETAEPLSILEVDVWLDEDQQE